VAQVGSWFGGPLKIAACRMQKSQIGLSRMSGPHYNLGTRKGWACREWEERPVHGELVRSWAAGQGFHIRGSLRPETRCSRPDVLLEDLPAAGATLR